MSDLDILSRVQATIESRKGAEPGSSYVASLYAKGTDSICKKVAEEAAETIMAAKDGDAHHLVKEVADLWFHSLVMLAALGQHPQAVLDELDRRFGLSGHAEKAARPQSE